LRGARPSVTDIRRSSISSMGVIQELAADLDVEERTLRRAASQGALRASRPGPRRLRLAPGEREYLRVHWPLLSELRRALRTEHGVRLVVLYGSLARGDEDGGSDLDLLVSLADDRLSADFELAARLRRVSGRRVDVARLERVEVRAPLLLDRVLDEGRVLVDRDGQWKRLCERGPAIRARALRSHRRQMVNAARAIKELTG
jgi:predicted nucleotidyltransferase